MIEISGLSPRPSRPAAKDAPVLALKDVNLRIQDGEFLTILGPSGCGKTTLLRMIAGLIDWDDGEITRQRQAGHAAPARSGRWSSRASP